MKPFLIAVLAVFLSIRASAHLVSPNCKSILHKQTMTADKRAVASLRVELYPVDLVGSFIDPTTRTNVNVTLA